ncbi:MAG: ATP-binding cassette domain-containing protein [Actinomycetales bacterium]
MEETEPAEGRPTIQVVDTTKVYGDSTVVDGLSFSVFPRVVTGFLGPNGAGKSTTMKMILGLVQATRGEALVCGRPIREISNPSRVMGSLIDPQAMEPNRTAKQHLMWIARMSGLGADAVSEKLETVGLTAAADKQVGGYSLGMKQRLALAASLIGDPQILMLDEPINGLDADGIVWMRNLLRSLAAEGRTVFLSSHLMSEMELTADRAIIINRGRLVEDVLVSELTSRAAGRRVLVGSVDQRRLKDELVGAGGTVAEEGDSLVVHGLEAPAIGQLAFDRGIPLTELHSEHQTLEEAFRGMTSHEGESEVRP